MHTTVPVFVSHTAHCKTNKGKKDMGMGKIIYVYKNLTDAWCKYKYLSSKFLCGLMYIEKSQLVHNIYFCFNTFMALDSKLALNLLILYIWQIVHVEPTYHTTIGGNLISHFLCTINLISHFLCTRERGHYDWWKYCLLCVFNPK